MPRESKPSREFRVLLTGGGSGGHVYPLLAVVEALKAKASQEDIPLRLFYYGPKDEYRYFLAPLKIVISTIVTGKLRGYFSLFNIFDIPKFFIGLLQVLWKMLWLMPDVIFSKGGPGALPVALVGWFYRIPVIIHESDVLPGLTNAISSRFASRILVSFEKTLTYFRTKKAVVVGVPLRSFLFMNVPSPEEAKKALGFEPDRSLILVTGGSQGSQRLNELILANAKELLREAQIFHQTGKDNYRRVHAVASVLFPEWFGDQENSPRPYRITPYLLNEELGTALAAADLVVGRAGSGTIFEAAAFGKPAILIPLPESANNHQEANGYEFMNRGAAIVIEEKNLLPGIFLHQVREILKNPEALENMMIASRQFFTPHAAENISEEILKYVNV